MTKLFLISALMTLSLSAFAVEAGGAVAAGNASEVCNPALIDSDTDVPVQVPGTDQGGAAGNTVEM